MEIALETLTYWHWFIAALIFITLEVFIPGILFLFLAIGAAAAKVGKVRKAVVSVTQNKRQYRAQIVGSVSLGLQTETLSAAVAAPSGRLTGGQPAATAKASDAGSRRCSSNAMNRS